MEETSQNGVTLEEPGKRRRPASRFQDLGDRLKTIPSMVRPESPEDSANEPDSSESDEFTSFYQAVPQFPLARSGYECAAVDEHIASLERYVSELEEEVEDLRAKVPERDQVAAELERVGEQTSSILLAAHDRARETMQAAQAQADRCASDAAANAASITEEANRKRAQIEADTRRVAGERSRLIEDLEALAETIASTAQEASSRLSSASPPARVIFDHHPQIEAYRTTGD